MDTIDTNAAPETSGAPAVAEEKPIREYNKEVRCKLSNQERERYGKRLANLLQEKDLLLEKKKQVNADYAVQIQEKDVDIANLADAIAKGEELRNMQVCEFWARNGNDIEIRIKATGEKVDERAASLADRQRTLPGVPESPEDEDEDPADEPEEEPPTGDHELDGDEPEDDGEMVASSTGAQVYVQPDSDDDGDDETADDDEDDSRDGDEPEGADDEKPVANGKPKAKKKGAASTPAKKNGVAKKGAKKRR